MPSIARRATEGYTAQNRRKTCSTHTFCAASPTPPGTALYWQYKWSKIPPCQTNIMQAKFPTPQSSNSGKLKHILPLKPKKKLPHLKPISKQVPVMLSPTATSEPYNPPRLQWTESAKNRQILNLSKMYFAVENTGGVWYIIQEVRVIWKSLTNIFNHTQSIVCGLFFLKMNWKRSLKKSFRRIMISFP